MSKITFAKQTKKVFATFGVLSTIAFSLAITSQIQALAQTPTIITNTATVSTGTTDANTLNNTATVNDRLCYSSDLSSSLTAPSNPTAGNSATYNGTISNAGPSTVTTTSITATYTTSQQATPTLTGPSGSTVTVVSTSETLGVATTIYTLSGISLASGGSINISFASAISQTALGSAVFSYTAIPTGPTNDGLLCGMTDPNLLNNTATVTANLLTVADVSIIKTSSGGSTSNPLTGQPLTVGTLYSGDTASYTLTLANLGPSTATGPITVIDTMPSEVTPQLVSGTNYTSSTNWDCSFNSTTRAMTCVNTNSLANGGVSQVVLGVTVN
jgi:uncharacterized repeat protein (TIGR01451 family)